jgi:hypothetical protein
VKPKVVKVAPQEDFTLLLSFSNGEQRIFDAKPYLSKGIFKELDNANYFSQVKPFFGGVGWPHEQDFSADTLYLENRALVAENVSG